MSKIHTYDLPESSINQIMKAFPNQNVKHVGSWRPIPEAVPFHTFEIEDKVTHVFIYNRTTEQIIDDIKHELQLQNMDRSIFNAIYNEILNGNCPIPEFSEPLYEDYEAYFNFYRNEEMGNILYVEFYVEKPIPNEPDAFFLKEFNMPHTFFENHSLEEILSFVKHVAHNMEYTKE